MSAHYDTEPPPTASATLQTTVGPIQISLFARQTPLACKNFLQHCLDGYYTNTTFHRIVPNFIVQGGDPTGTGSGGSSIYEDPEFETDPRDGEKIVFGDEIHSRLRFNRRGLLGMAKSEDGSYGSQFFITLGNAERELNKTCTMFGRVEGDGIYNVVKIAEAELVEGTDRPVYAIKVTGCEVQELGPFEGVLKRREKVATAAVTGGDAGKVKRKAKGKKNKAGKALLSFGVDEEGEGEEGGSFAKPTKPKFNPKLVRDDGDEPHKKSADTTKAKVESSKLPTASTTSKPSHKVPPPKSPTRRPAPRDPHTQLPLPDEEEPSRSPSHSHSPSPSPSPPPQKSSLSRTNAEIAALKASMRRDTSFTPAEPTRKKTALESLIPETSIRGRKRRPPGSDTDAFTSADKDALKMFNAFKARLESAEEENSTTTTAPSKKKARHDNHDDREGKKLPDESLTSQQPEKAEDEEEEQQLCDLHFIVNCQSCRAWDVADGNTQGPNDSNGAADEDDNETDWMTHTLQFGKDMLGKDLNWKRKNQDADDLVVIDPRQKEKEVIGGRKREKERRRKMEGVREWDQRGR